jgi:hypothetical protein
LYFHTGFERNILIVEDNFDPTISGVISNVFNISDEHCSDAGYFRSAYENSLILIL